MRAFITGVAGSALTDEERRFLRDTQPWGFIIFKRNVTGAASLRRLIDDCRSAVGRNAPVLIDQEGGRVQRLGPPDWPSYPPGAVYGALYDRDREKGLAAARLGARLIAADLAILGIDVDCLPLGDVPVAGADAVIGDRAYGTAPDKVAAIAAAVAEGLAEGGVLPVLKHIPGHGRATADSHKKLPVVGTDRETLNRTDFAAFRPLRDLPMAMTAHVVFNAIDPLAPGTLSPLIVKAVIRDSIGFQGLLMSDDISMGALAGSLAERSAAAIAAGCDVVLHCNGEMPEMRAVAAAVPELTGEAARRAAAALAAKRPAAPIDIAARRTEFSRLMAGTWQPAEGTA
jgi:beta-N-acetylhexosaminidase